ncbi:MAG TPA: 2-oxoacid:ferredoxin oxidoreductase subunit beta [Dehalococcoidia bacterium]|nr:2-oxoacid:ferredoxin oxidoreductase subunit beta [Dehalococcoidia bacterium]
MVTKDKPAAHVPVLTKRDFQSNQETRWCPGCGDYSILAQTQKMLPNLGIPREKIVFISGIGCSSRFPYYMNAYGMHSIHGRALTIASGLKLSRPDLTVFVITGDGDSLSIGGNHFIHAMRRNVDINVLQFNNQIYGLTKGQYSPTSEVGKVTKSSPLGSIEEPLKPIPLALTTGATFVARTFDTDPNHLATTLEQAGRHKGISFVEVLQNCNIFNDGAYRGFTDKPVRSERMVYLEDGQPIVFGDDRDKGVALRGTELEVVAADDPSVLVHDATRDNTSIANMLALMTYPEMPVPVGVFRQVDRLTYGDALDEQIAEATAKRGEGDLAALIRGENTWLVE